MKKIILFSFLGIAVIGLSGCAGPVQQNKSISTTAVSDQKFIPNEFDYQKIKVGQKVLNMTAEFVGPETDTQPIGPENFKVAFSGQATVEGDYVNNGNQSMGPAICFSNLDRLSLDSLPNQQGAQPRSLDFCFRPDQATEKAFAPVGSKGHAQVIIDNFSYISAGESANMADLVKVLKKSQII